MARRPPHQRIFLAVGIIELVDFPMLGARNTHSHIIRKAKTRGIFVHSLSRTYELADSKAL